MARSKTDDTIISALGRRRTELQVQIDAVQQIPLTDLQTELTEIEAKLKSIDPTILSIAEERAAVSGEIAAKLKS